MRAFLKNTALLLCFLLVHGCVGQAPRLYSKYMSEELAKANPELVRCYSQKPFMECMKFHGAQVDGAVVERLTNRSKWIAWSAAILQWLLVLLFGYLFARINRPKSPVSPVSA